MKYDCPSCGAPIQFTSALSLYCVCNSCLSQVFRTENEIELIGKQASLPDDVSPLQLFSEGEFNGKSFKIIGRCKLQWDAGSWNEWYISFSDGSTAWLAEAQGKWILTFEQNDVVVPDQKDVELDNEYILNSVSFIYTDLKHATSYGFEGELPFKTVQGEKRFSVDLTSNQSKKFLSFEYDTSDSRAYLGQYVTLSQLKMKNMREFDGWKTN